MRGLACIFALVTFGVGAALGPDSAAAQSCDLCDNGMVGDEVAHQFGLPLGENFACGDVGQYECHDTYAVAGKCSDEHCFCGSTECQHLTLALYEAILLESPSLLQKAMAGAREVIDVNIDADSHSRALSVVNCNGAVIMTYQLSSWVTDHVLSALDFAVARVGPDTLVMNM